MARTISQSAMSAMLAETSTMVPVVLLEIDHPSFTERALYCNNNEDVIFSGDTYKHYPFEITFPKSTGSDEMITSQITIANVSQDLIAMIRGVSTPPDIILHLGYVDGSSHPPVLDTIEYGPLTLKYKKQDVTPSTITGTLSFQDDFLNKQFLSRTFNPATAAGIFE